MSYFSKLRKQLKTYMDKPQIEQIHQAYLLAEAAHSPQKRQSGEPYVTHPVAVATSLAELHLDSETVMAALLHDTIEDTYVEKSDIVQKFGQSVADLVDGMSKLTQISFPNRAEAQAENFRKMVLAMSHDLRVILVKLADRLHNMQTLGVVSEQKRRRVARETLEIYTPLANRLGMHKFRVELEDLCFKALYPHREKTLRDNVRKLRGNRREVVEVIEQAISNACKLHHLKYLDVSGREKHLYSIYRKMRDRQLSLSEIMDVYAFRIIVDNIEDCYRVLGYVHGIYKPVPERFKDYIAIPKANGYQSLHTTLFGPYGVPIEIQIRTKLMNDMAENGIAAHWLYKAGDPSLNTEAQVRAQAWVKNLVEMQKSSANPLEFVENVKIDLFPDEVYVFTPKGEIIELPAGATPIDFAYAIHSDVGNTCIATKVDRQYALLSKPLSNGQTVEIICAPNAQPNPSWLDFAITGKARSTIRHYFKRKRSNESIDLGKVLLTKALAKLNLTVDSITDATREYVLNTLGLSALDELYEKVGMGNYTARLIAQRFKDSAEADLSLESVEQQEMEPVSIRGTEGLVVNICKCCYPIPGDPIVGEIQAGEGMLVHAESCDKINLVDDESQYIPLRWEVDTDQDFEVEIDIDVENKTGVLNELTTVIAQSSTNIEDFWIKHRKGADRLVVFLIRVKNRQHLAKVIRRLEKLSIVRGVRRGKFK